MTRRLTTASALLHPFANHSESLQDQVQALVEQGKSVEDVKTAVGDAAALTFSFLVMQLHGRGSQAFWQQQTDKTTSAYLIYRLVDIFADVLTKIEADGYNPQYCREVLEWFGSEAWYDCLEQQFVALATLVKHQRESKPAGWIPDEVAIAEVMRDFKQHGDVAVYRRHDHLWYGVAAAAVVVASIVILRVWSRR